MPSIAYTVWLLAVFLKRIGIEAIQRHDMRTPVMDDVKTDTDVGGGECVDGVNVAMHGCE